MPPNTPAYPLSHTNASPPAHLPPPLQAYAAWLGFYNSAKGMGWSKPELVEQANRFAGRSGLGRC